MRYGGAFRFLAALLLIGVVGTLMALSYGAGAASQGAVVATGGRHFVGFLFGGFLVVLFLMLIFGAIGAGHRGHRYGSWSRFGPPGPDDWHGRSHWHGDDWAGGPSAALNEWHRQAHAGQGPTTGDAPGGAASGPTGGPASGPTPRAQA
ncbi:MAG: hypothetical protein ACXWNR_01045 [Candidatus Limnocylindrales bacterium]